MSWLQQPRLNTDSTRLVDSFPTSGHIKHSLYNPVCDAVCECHTKTQMGQFSEFPRITCHYENRNAGAANMWHRNFAAFATTLLDHFQALYVTCTCVLQSLLNSSAKAKQ